MYSVLIVGYGVVGKNLAEEIDALQPHIYDIKFKQFDYRRDHYDFCFICVDTPYVSKENPCDLTQIYNAIEDNNAELYIIKSTILPGTVEKLKAKYNKHIIFSPEYYGGTQHCNNFKFDFTVLGGNRQDCLAVQQLLQHVYDARHSFRIVDATTAELLKYMENSWLASKVSFCHQFYDIANQTGVNYEELRELFILDPRVNPSHTFVYRDHDYWDSHCLNKDVPAIAETYDAELLKAVIDFNKKRLK